MDLNWVPEAGREKRLLIADMDSTMIGCECIDELADFAGKKAEVAAITEAAMRGELDFRQALDARVAMLRGVTTADIEACRLERVQANPGAQAAIRTMNARGAQTVLVSGGFTAFAEPVGESLGFQRVRANVLGLDGDALSGAVTGEVVTAETKLEELAARVEALGIDIAQTIAVGDGANDALMVESAGLGVAYKAKPALREVADAVLDHSDLTALLALQGIPIPA